MHGAAHDLHDAAQRTLAGLLRQAHRLARRVRCRALRLEVGADVCDEFVEGGPARNVRNVVGRLIGVASPDLVHFPDRGDKVADCGLGECGDEHPERCVESDAGLHPAEEEAGEVSCLSRAGRPPHELHALLHGVEVRLPLRAREAELAPGRLGRQLVEERQVQQAQVERGGGRRAVRLGRGRGEAEAGSGATEEAEERVAVGGQRVELCEDGGDLGEEEVDAAGADEVLGVRHERHAPLAGQADGEGARGVGRREAHQVHEGGAGWELVVRHVGAGARRVLLVDKGQRRLGPLSGVAQVRADAALVAVAAPEQLEAVHHHGVGAARRVRVRHAHPDGAALAEAFVTEAAHLGVEFVLAHKQQRAERAVGEAQIHPEAERRDRSEKLIGRD